MTEADWLACTTQPAPMLRDARRFARRRKLMLLGCGCCRLVWDHLGPVDRARAEAAEREADGAEQYPPEPAPASISDPPGEDDGGTAAAARNVVWAATHPDLWNGLDRVVGWVQTTAARADPDDVKAALTRARGELCGLFREVVGNPFRPWQVVPGFLGGGLVQPDGRAVPVTDTARQLAAAIYSERAFDRLPVLADAAEEGGITGPALLDHLRHGTGHVRGCWALDLLLGKG